MHGSSWKCCKQTPQGKLGDALHQHVEHRAAHPDLAYRAAGWTCKHLQVIMSVVEAGRRTWLRESSTCTRATSLALVCAPPGPSSLPPPLSLSLFCALSRGWPRPGSHFSSAVSSCCLHKHRVHSSSAEKHGLGTV